MIDNPDHVERLFAKLDDAFPPPARMTAELAASLHSSGDAAVISQVCSINSISYAGDQGGVMCELDLLNEHGKAIYVSITHLRFDPRLPVARVEPHTKSTGSNTFADWAGSGLGVRY